MLISCDVIYSILYLLFFLLLYDTWDLSVRNPNGNDDVIHRSPEEIIAEIEALEVKNNAALNRIKDLL